jgi:hypothetical protein
MKKRKIENEHAEQNAFIQLPIGPHDLLALENILSGNIGYLRNTASLSEQTVTKIGQLEKMKTRIQQLRLGGEGERESVSRDDVLVLRTAMQTFVQLTRRLVPPSPERDETLKRVGLLRNHLETLLLP